MMFKSSMTHRNNLNNIITVCSKPLFLFLIGMTIIMASPAKAEDYYVDANNGDNVSGSGSQESPWMTISYSLAQVTGPGVTIHIAPGTYDTVMDGTWYEVFPIYLKDGVSLVGTDKNVTIIDADHTAIVFIGENIGDQTKISNLTIRNGKSNNYGMSSFPEGNITVRDSDLIIENNIIEGGKAYFGGSGILMVGSSCTIRNNIIRNCTSGSYGGPIEITNFNPNLKNFSAPLIQGNLILNNSCGMTNGAGAAIVVDDWIDGGEPIISNNIIYNTGGHGITVGGGSVFGEFNTTIMNNTIVESDGNGIYLTDFDVGSVIIVNNIITDNAYGIYETKSQSDPEYVKYNLFYNNSNGHYFNEGTQSYSSVNNINSLIPECSNNLEGDPLFIDSTNGNYHLQKGSPAIDAGDPVEDFSKEPMPNGERINIGAYGNTPEATTNNNTAKVATPTFSPAPGKYNSPQNLTISCSTTGATIHYTEDGTEPTEASLVYTSAIEIPLNTTKTIKAKAFKTDWTASDVLEGTYTITIEQETGTLVIHPKEGTEPEYYDVGNTVPLKAIFKDMDGSSADVSIFLTWTSSDTDIGEVSASGSITFKAQGAVTITATGGGLIAQKTFQVGQPQQITKHHGNLIIVAGGGLSEADTLKNATQYLANRMYQVFKTRGFEDGDIYYINPQPVQDLDGNGQNDGIVDSSTTTVTELQYAIDWAASQPNDGPLYIYLMDHGGDQTFKIGPSAILTATLLDSYLDEFESETFRKSIVMIEACHSGTFVEPLTDSDRLIITSADSKLAYLSPSGDISFSQILSTNFIKGMTWTEAFENTKTQLTQMGMPYNNQKPQIHTGQEIVASYIGGEFVLADFLPTISDYTKSKDVLAETSQAFSVTIETLDVSGLAAWATVTPPLYQPPQVTEDFETPSLGLDTFDLTNQSEATNFTGSYSFTYNGTYKLIFYVKDKNNNVVSTPPIEIGVTGGTDPSFQSSMAANWNLLSLPVVTTDPSVDNLLSGVMDNIISVWKWADGDWAVYLPGEADKGAAYASSKNFGLLTDITCGQGFWVNSNIVQTLTVSGTQPANSSCSLTEGWNLIGLKSNQSQAITDLISGQESKIDSIWKWENNNWAVYLPGQDTAAYATGKGFDVLADIEPGEGFWVNANEAITLN